MEQAIQYLFVYSSLRSGFQHPAYAYISNYFIFEQEATVKGKLYDKETLIVGVPTDEDLYIKGELYHIKEPSQLSWALAQLDDYEGVQQDEDDANMPPLYKRAITTVYHNSKSCEAWVYWYNRTISRGQLIESGDMLDYLQKKK
jgi:gamma-glutamylcyclotransferase (GGCT)/AIG2-like uncharacterized protein YtfP